MTAPRRPSVNSPRFSWQLKVELLDVRPTVWRRLIVPERITLPKLHQAFQEAFGWTDSHLHEFLINGRRYGMRDVYDDDPPRDERRVALNKALDYRTRTFDYIYDFGDNWHHAVTVESDYVNTAPGQPGLLVIDGANACPPEDVGGASGYATFLEALADPHHEEHENFLRWVGGPFDPTLFHLPAANLRLARIKV